MKIKVTTVMPHTSKFYRPNVMLVAAALALMSVIAPTFAAEHTAGTPQPTANTAPAPAATPAPAAAPAPVLRKKPALAPVLPGPGCSWVGRQALLATLREDIVAANDLMLLFEHFECDKTPLKLAFDCVAAAPAPGQPDKLVARIDACWSNPASPAILGTITVPAPGTGPAAAPSAPGAAPK